MRTLSVICALLLLALSAMVCGADVPASPDYVLGIDDVIEVAVENHTDLNKTLTILPDGKIAFPEVGEIVAAGKTPRQLAAALQLVLEKSRNNVSVIISVKEVNSRKVRAVGAVRLPSSYSLKPGWRLMDLVAVAGGFSAKPALISGNLIRASSKVIPVNVVKAMAQPDTDANPVLQVDDLLVLDQADAATRQVHVIGEVAKPGAFDLQDGTTLVSLISQAGSPTERAALSKAYVLRGTTKMPIDLRKILVEGKDQKALTDLALQPGDALFIPEVDERFVVMGQVRQPGYYPVSERQQMTVMGALSIAGGQVETGDIARVGIIRMVDGKSTVIPVNIDRMIKKRDLSANLPLQANDIVYVPARTKRGISWADVTSPLYALSLLGLRRY